jgi:tRNA A-37 threonylcarbamoyl transferase component Bud32
MSETQLRIQQFKRQKKSHLDLSGMGLIVLPTELFSLEGLKTLDLSANKLGSLDSRIGLLTGLQELNLDSNNLKALPNEMAKLKQLTNLSLKGNPLNSVFLPLQTASGQSLQVAIGACLKKYQDVEADSLFDDGWGDEPKGKKPMKKVDDDDQDFDFGFGDSKKPEPKPVSISSHSKTLSGSSPVGRGTTSIGGSRVAEKPKPKQDDFDVDNLMESLTVTKSTKGFYQAVDEEEEVKLEEVTLGPKLSQGGYSLVHKGVFRGTEVAIKKIFDPVITDKLREEIDNEVYMLNRIRHPHIVIMMGYSTKPPNLFIIFELLKKGSLFDLLHKQKEKLPEPVKLKIARQVASALNFIHQSKVVHRDVKSLNVLLDEQYNTRLCDFGIARKFVSIGSDTVKS